MKVTIKNTELNNGIITMIAFIYNNKDSEMKIKIDTREKSNLEYLSEKLHRYPWARQCDKWGEVIRKMQGKTLELRLSKIEIERI